MSQQYKHVISSNRQYAETYGDESELAAAPARKIAILTCMDARLDPLRFAGLSIGDAHVIRNAGGRASDDAIRSLVISHKLLGTDEWFVIHHTDCGMTMFTEDVMGDLLSESLKTASLSDSGWSNVSREGGSIEGRYIKWLTIHNPDKTIKEDVTRIKNHPLVSPDITVYGFIIDVKTGKLKEIE